MRILESYYVQTQGNMNRQECVDCIVRYAGVSRSTAYEYYKAFMKERQEPAYSEDNKSVKQEMREP